MATSTELPTARLSGLGLLLLCFSVLTSVTNASMASIVLPELQEDFGVADDTLSWFVTAFIIPFAVGTLVFGRLADLWGTRRLFAAGMAIFALASFAVAASPTFEASVAARVVQGVGATSVPALSIATIVRTTIEPRRTRALGATVVAVGIGFGIGPLLGGVLAEGIGWQGPFLVTGVVALLLTPVLYLTLPPVAGTPGLRFDAPGAVLVGLAVTGLVVALNRLPNEPGDPAGLTGAIAVLPLLAVFARRIQRVQHPFVDPEILRNRQFVTLALVGFAIQGTHYGIVVLLPLLLERYHDLSTIDIGLHLLPGALVLAATGIGGGWLAERFGTRVFLVAGTWILFNIAVTFVAIGAGWGPWGITGVYVAFAAGYGMANATVLSAATARLPEESAGSGVGVFTLSFFLGGAVTVALEGAILRLREDAGRAWLGLFDRDPTEFSDAGLVLVGVTAAGFLLTMFIEPAAKHAAQPEPNLVPASLVGRQKPNRPG